MNYDEFDGAENKCRLERGQSYGLSRETYWALANASMAVKEYGNIQPCSIERLEGRPGARVVLYGKRLCFYLSVESASEPASVKLEAVGLDAIEEPFEVVSGVDWPRDWMRVIDAMLGLDGLAPGRQALSYEEASELMRKQGLL